MKKRLLAAATLLAATLGVHAQQTDCSTPLPLPYYENFDSYDVGNTRVAQAGAPTPNCWTMYGNGLYNRDTAASAYIYFGGVGTMSSTSSFGCVTANNPYFGLVWSDQYHGSSENHIATMMNTGTVRYAVLPAFEEPMSHLVMKFDYRGSSNTVPSYLYVGYVTTDTGSFVAVDTLQAIRTTVRQAELIFGQLSANIPAGARIALKVQSTYNDTSATGGPANNFIGIDNVSVEALPACMRPLDLTLLHVGDTTATLGWRDISEPAATAWEAIYGPLGFNPEAEGDGVVVSLGSNPGTITGLTMDTRYEVYLRTACGEGEASEWSGPVQLRTTCPAGGDAIFGTEKLTMFSIVAGNRANTMAQVILTAEELAEEHLQAGDTISNLVFDWNHYYASQENRALQIYIGHTDVDTFATYGAQWLHPTDLQLVLEDTLYAAAEGETRYDLTTPFVWNGESNLVLCTFVNRPAIDGYSNVAGMIANAHNAGANRTAIYYNDVPYYGSNLNTLTMADTATKEASSTVYRPNIIIERACYDTASAVAPEPVVVMIDSAVCFGTEVVFFDTVVSSSAVYTHTTDDTITMLTLTVWPTYADTVHVDTTGSYSWQDVDFTADTTYTLAAQTIHGCDSLTTLVLHIAVDTTQPTDTIDPGTDPGVDPTPTDSTGISSVNLGSVSIHPNPASTTLTIKADERVQVQLFDMGGRMVMQSTEARRTHSIDVSALPRGAYMVRTSGANGSHTQKLLLK